MKKILSIDGGGIRGIIPAIILKEIEDKTEQDIAKIFDLIAGTSTGGLLALGLGKDGGGGNEKRYKAKDLVKIYEDRGKDIFGDDLRRKTSDIENAISDVNDKISSLKKMPIIRKIPLVKHWVEKIDKLILVARGATDEIYSHEEGIVKVLNCYFGEAELKHVRQCTKVMVTCYDIHAPGPVFLKSWYPEHHSVRIQDAARATSAAPTYFEPIKLKVGDTKRALIDGGIFINSPAVSAYAEAKKAFPCEKDFFVLSLGTGIYTKRFEHKKAKDWGKVEWFIPLLDCIFDGMQDAVHYQMDRFLGDEDYCRSNYFRFTENLSEDNQRMDNVDDCNIESLKAVAKGIIKSEDFKKFIKRLKQLIRQSDSPA